MKKEQVTDKCLHCTACSSCEAIHSFKIGNRIVHELQEIYNRTSDLCVAKAKTQIFIREWLDLESKLKSYKDIKELINY